jgi:hypothetical protein
MSPEKFNRLENTSKEDFDRFVDWLFSHALTEIRAARGDADATKAAWIAYFRHGVKADLLLDELMGHVPELFRRARYADYDAPKVLALIKALNLEEIGINPGAPLSAGKAQMRGRILIFALLRTGTMVE